MEREPGLMVWNGNNKTCIGFSRQLLTGRDEKCQQLRAKGRNEVSKEKLPMGKVPGNRSHGPTLLVFGMVSLRREGRSTVQEFYLEKFIIWYDEHIHRLYSLQGLWDHINTNILIVMALILFTVWGHLSPNPPPFISIHNKNVKFPFLLS